MENGTGARGLGQDGVWTEASWLKTKWSIEHQSTESMTDLEWLGCEHSKTPEQRTHLGTI